MYRFVGNSPIRAHDPLGLADYDEVTNILDPTEQTFFPAAPFATLFGFTVLSSGGYTET